jgi:hypothetical protein
LSSGERPHDWERLMSKEYGLIQKSLWACRSCGARVIEGMDGRPAPEERMDVASGYALPSLSCEEYEVWKVQDS